MEYKKIKVAYGDEIVGDFIPADINSQVLTCPACKRAFSGTTAQRLDDVLANPVDSPPLEELLKKRERKCVTIIVDDTTRPNKHTKILLPMVLDRLLSSGVEKKDIVLLIATGSHDHPSPETVESKVLGKDVYLQWSGNVVVHQQGENCTRIGTSSFGTPVKIDNQVLDAGLVISLSDSEYHYFAGVAGTLKQFFPGCAGKETIARNHPQMFDYELGFKPACRLGNTAGNPVIEDISEMVKVVAKLVPVFCLDAVVEEGEIVILNGGNIFSLHEMAVEFLKPIRVIDVDEPADLVIVSTGSLAVNLYQSGKGLHAGWNAVKQGGDVLLLARCEQGHGNDNYSKTMLEIAGMDNDESLKWVINKKCQIATFKIGNQKPVDLLRILKRCDLHILTEMDEQEIEDFRLKYVPWQGNAQESLRAWIENYRKHKNKNPLVYILPDAGILVKVRKR